MSRTLKQRWSFERCFANKGSLIGIRSRLNQIGLSHSTLPDEQAELFKAADIVDRIQFDWNMKERKTDSWNQFRKVKEALKKLPF